MRRVKGEKDHYQTRSLIGWCADESKWTMKHGATDHDEVTACCDEEDFGLDIKEWGDTHGTSGTMETRTTPMTLGLREGGGVGRRGVLGGGVRCVNDALRHWTACWCSGGAAWTGTRPCLSQACGSSSGPPCTSPVGAEQWMVGYGDAETSSHTLTMSTMTSFVKKY